MKEENFENENGNGDIENENENEIEIYTLIDEEDKESDFVLIKRIDIEGQSYVAFEPYSENGEVPEEYDEDEDSFVILKVSEEDGEEVFVTIDDDEEFDRVADIFEDELMQDIEDDGENENEDDDE